MPEVMQVTTTLQGAGDFSTIAFVANPPPLAIVDTHEEVEGDAEEAEEDDRLVHHHLEKWRK